VSREIRYRLWDGHAMVIAGAHSRHTYGQFLIKMNGEVCVDGENGVEDTADCVALMQYTGLKDKNGKEIFEGDVVKARGFEPELHIVRFDRGGFCLEPVEGRELPSHFWPDIKYVEDEHGEITGNIYENPELIK